MKTNKTFTTLAQFAHVRTIFTALFLTLLLASAYSETIEFSADSMSGTVNDNLNYTRLIGSADVATESIELKADEIELNGDDYRYIVASGNITGEYIEAGFTFSCDALRYDRESKIAVLEGAVSMFDTENNVDLKADFIEYNQNTEVALIQVEVEIKKDESVCTAAFALYRKDIQILELSGSPKITQEEDVFQAHEIVFNLDTEEITLIGNVKGVVVDADENEDDETGAEETDEDAADTIQTEESVSSGEVLNDE